MIWFVVDVVEARVPPFLSPLSRSAVDSAPAANVFGTKCFMHLLTNAFWRALETYKALPPGKGFIRYVVIDRRPVDSRLFPHGTGVDETDVL